MSRVILARLATAVPLLVATTLLAFLLVYWAPGTFLDRFRLDPRISDQLILELEHRYGLDRPWYVQYSSWLSALFRGDFGFSLGFQRPVRDLLQESVSRTLILAGLAQIFCLLAGIGLGLFSASRLRRLWDRIACRGALALVSVHPVVIGVVGMYVAAMTGILPLGGGSSLDASSLSFGGRTADYLRHLVLPEITLTLVLLPGFFLQARGSMEEVLPSSFVRAGRARGLSERQLLFRHVLPLGLVPIVSLAGSSIARLLSLAFLVEVVTGWPGMGRLALKALLDRDPFLLMGTLVVSGTLVILGGLLSDLILAEVDPRIRLEEASA